MQVLLPSGIRLVLFFIDLKDEGASVPALFALEHLPEISPADLEDLRAFASWAASHMQQV
jgi:hypothetical protein